jgi:NAD-dependent SIR2 family protein deacetylase
MKATMNKEEYKKFTENVDKLNRREKISIPHAVEFKGDMIEVSLLENIDLHHIDNLLEKIDSKG